MAKTKLTRWQRFKQWSTVDRWIDLIVDIGLLHLMSYLHDSY